MMTAQLPKSYSPAESEAQVRERWDNSGAFHAEPGPWQHRPEDLKPQAASLKPFCIVIPPPNVTAALHLGHAFNITLQDVLIRYHRMCGFNTLWMPGTDHAGIATQTVVEKRLLQQGTSRKSLGREEFVAKVQAWKDQYEATIIEQLKAMGCSCDWARTRFTMDEMCAKAVREAFFGLFKDGLIYRGKRLVNWDPATLTALADDEVQMQDVHGRMWYLRYPLTPGRLEGEETHEYVTVATTRPETMLGDAAVAINPKDPRAERYIGRHVRLPIVDRVVPIIGDDHVVMPGDADNPMAEYATGFLKVTPAHDPDDWEIGLRHQLPVINVMAPDATISADYGWKDIEEPSREAARYFGLSREEARDQVVEWFRKHGLLEEAREYRHQIGHSYRSHVPIEPYLSDQWYVKVTDDSLVGEAQRALAAEQFEGAPPKRQTGSPTVDGDGGLTFFPARYARMYQAWHENLRDWCISRQLWWGHRIPVWYLESALESPDRRCPDSKVPRPQRLRELPDGVAEQKFGSVTFTCIRDPEGEHKELVQQLEASGYVQDPDVLDTWFSSALWPHATLGWPDTEHNPPLDEQELAKQTQAENPQSEIRDPQSKNEVLPYFYPGSVLITTRDIITLWVARMVLTGLYNMGDVPFKHVHVHPKILDGYGQTMSKSKGNGVNPLDLIDKYGTDAVRFTIASFAGETQDVRLPIGYECPHCETVIPQTLEHQRAKPVDGKKPTITCP
ncbi:MAG: valine--tRNA ligase, partial [Planctomycetes bacterium]|nr:valine--tRNA ligase [Planctomycetota bacterium]